MARLLIGVAVLCSCLTVGVPSSADESLRVLPETIDGAKPSHMMSHYLLRQAHQRLDDWKLRYEQRKTPQQIADYQKSLRERFVEAVGGFPDRTPLNPQITGVISRDGYRVEKVIFESQPRHHVTALLFMPDETRHKPRYPGVLIPCGHSKDGKAYDTYQTMGALLALNGMAALVFDPIDQGERVQLLSQSPELWGTKAHTMIAVGSILLGRSTAMFEIWDCIRAIDYLQSRPEVDPNRIGCTGNSGGGTQASYLMALDDRIIAAAPSCYITSFGRLLATIGVQDAEQNIFGQLAFGMDHADYLMMRAPTPILVCSATGDFFDISGTWDSFRYAKRLYSRLGYSERIDLLENDAGHNYNRLQRQAVARWMVRWLLGKDTAIAEPEIKLLSNEEVQCTPAGQVMTLEGARSVYDLNRDFEKELAQRRKRLWATTPRDDLLNRVRQIAGIRRFAELPKPKVEELGVIERTDYRVSKLILKPEDGIYLPALMFVPHAESPLQTDANRGVVLYVHEKGKSADAAPGGPIEELVRAGKVVLAVDLRGTGETQREDQPYFKPEFGSDGQDVFTAYILGRSYVAMRADDILACAGYLHEQAAPLIELIAVGNAGVPALHAAALEPELFRSVKLIRPLVSWSNVIELGRSSNQLINTIHAALTVYDLTDLSGLISDKLTVVGPTDSLGLPIPF